MMFLNVYVKNLGYTACVSETGKTYIGIVKFEKIWFGQGLKDIQ